MKKSTRLLVILMALCMLCGVLASCGGSTDTPTPTVDNTTAARDPETTQPPRRRMTRPSTAPRVRTTIRISSS